MNNLSSTSIETAIAVFDRHSSYFGEMESREVAEALRELLALREAGKEPVAHIFKHPAGKLFWALTDESNKGQRDVIPVYAAPQLPAVPGGDPRDKFELQFPMPKFVRRCGNGYALSEFNAWDGHKFIDRWNGWNACLSAIAAAPKPEAAVKK